MKRSVTIRVICLIVAAVLLSGAVAIAAVTGSPYETLKKAVLDALTYRNVTAESRLTLELDGVLKSEEKSYHVSGDGSYLNYSFDENGDQDGYFYYSANGLSVNPMRMTNMGSEQWYTGYFNMRDSHFGAYSGGFGMFSPEDRDSAELRFMELLVDALVGDLKNNVTMSSSGGIRTVRATLTESQVPELIKAGVDLLVEQSGRYYGEERDFSGYDMLDIPLKSLTIDYIRVAAEIDADGNLLNIEGSGTASLTNILKQNYEVEIKAEVRFSDIGTSRPSCPIPGADDLLTAEFLRARFGSEHINFYFTLNPDGSVNEDSVTTTFPGEFTRQTFRIDLPSSIVLSANAPYPALPPTTAALSYVD